MHLKVKEIGLSSGGPLVAVINQKDATALDLHALDRIRIIKGKKQIIAAVDIAETEKNAKIGEIGLFEETLHGLNAKKGDIIRIAIEEKPSSIDYIKKKLDGSELNKQEIKEIVQDIVSNELTEVELTYFVAGCYSHKLSNLEIKYLTQAIKETGNVVCLKGKKTLDKHSIGGIPGNRTSMIIVPIIAAANFFIPKTSSRAISSASGTADTMEVLANVGIPCNEVKKIVEKVNGCIVWGGSIDLASADDKLIRIRNPLGLDPEGLLIASILAKKLAVNSKYVLIDISVGKYAKIKNKKKAQNIKRKFENLGRGLGMKIKVMISDGSEPIGNGVGSCLEARDVLYVLRRDPKRPLDLEKKAIKLASELLKIAGVKAAEKKVKEILESGLAYEKMKQIIKAQGGNELVLPEDIRIGKFEYGVNAWKSGRITKINNKLIARTARIAGSPIDKEAGLYLYVHKGYKVKKGQKLFTVFSDNKSRLKFAKDIDIKKVIEIT